ncbi:MAG TPA: DUF721 domain-containing protein [Chitinophagales bacterium]|nr:DUF721 domain-containing protein [Chitinophagales bacterium]
MGMRKNSVTLKEALELMVREFRLSSGVQESRIRETWPRIMGTMIARNTASINLRKGKLYLKVNSAALKHELSFSKEKIKEVLNKELGDNVINDVLIL